MSGENEIKFTRNGKNVIFKLGNRVKNYLKCPDNKVFKPLFEAIINSDGNKKISESEFEMLKKLEYIFANTGENQGESNGHVLDETDATLFADFKASGEDIETFITKKFEEVQGLKSNSVTENVSDVEAEKVVKSEGDPAGAPQSTQQQGSQSAVEPPVTTSTQRTERKQQSSEPTREERLASFNRSMQNLSSRYQADELAYDKVVKVQRGMTLTSIAKQVLKEEGIDRPTNQQINARIAQIVASNPSIKDVNNIKIGMEIKVGKTSAAGQGGSEAVRGQGGASQGAGGAQRTGDTQGAGGAQGAEGDVVVDTAAFVAAAAATSVDLNGWEEAAGAPAPEGIDLAGGVLKTYTKGTGDDTQTKYVYQKDGVEFEAETLEDLKSKVEKLNNALTELNNTVADETPEAKQARIAKAIDDILSLGTESAVKKAIEYLKTDGYVDIKSDEVQAFVQELIKTKNVEVLKELLLVDGDNDTKVFSRTLLGNNKTSAETLASLYTEIRAKENRGERLTDKEVELKEFLTSQVTGNTLYKIAGDKDNGIVDKDMCVNYITGIQYYTANIEGLGYVGATDPKILDAFAKDYAAATDDEKKAALFKKYAGTEDKMFARSLAGLAANLKASKEDVLEFVNKNDMNVLELLNYTPSEEDAPAFKKAVADRVVALYEAGKGDPANMRYLGDALDKIDAATYESEDEEQKAKDKILESFFEVTETTEGEGDGAVTTKHYTFKPLRRPTQEEISVLLKYSNKEMAKAVLDYIPSIDDLGKGQYTQCLETETTTITTADLKAKYAELFDKAAAEFDLENDLDGAKAKVLKFIDAVGPNIDLIPFDKIQEKFGDVEFVKEHLGPQREEYDEVFRKLTVLDLDIQESEPDSEGKVTYSVAFTMAVLNDCDIVAELELEADTKEELLKKAEAYIELQNIVYETRGRDGAYTDAERDVNMTRLNEMFNDENMDRDVKLAIVNFAVGNWGLYNEELIDSIIETKDPDFIKEESIGWYGARLTDAQAHKLIEYAKDPKLADGKNNPFYLGTASGNNIRTTIVNRKKKEEIEAIYDSLRPSDRLQVIRDGSVDKPAEKFEQLVKDIIDEEKTPVPFYDILTLAMDKGYALPKDTTDKLMAKIKRPLPVHSGRNPIYSWADAYGVTIFYQLEYQDNNTVKFVQKSTKDYAAEIKYEIDNNGAGHKIEKRQAEALSRLSSSAVADVILEYGASGKGLIKSWNDEYAWFGDALGVDDMMPVIKKVLEYGNGSDKASAEYKALQDLLDPYLDGEGNVNTSKDFPSSTATAIDNAMIAYIKMVRGIQ